MSQIIGTQLTSLLKCYNKTTIMHKESTDTHELCNLLVVYFGQIQAHMNKVFELDFHPNKL